MNITAITKCRECGSESLTWDIHSKTDSDVAEGRLRSHEVKCLFVLGCDDCSETLEVVSADQVATLMNKTLSASPARTEQAVTAARLDSALAVLRKVEMTPIDRWYADGLNVEVAQILRDNELATS